MNCTVATDGVTALLPARSSEWRDAFHALASSPDLRQRLGAAGRRVAETRYSSVLIAAKLADHLKSVVTSEAHAT